MPSVPSAPGLGNQTEGVRAVSEGAAQQPPLSGLRFPDTEQAPLALPESRAAQHVRSIEPFAVSPSTPKTRVAPILL